MKSRNWMLKAFVLGVVFFIAALLVKPVGVSTQFSVLSGIIHSTVRPNIITEDPSRETGYKSTNAYYDRNDGKIAEDIKNPLNYGFVFVLAIPLGSYIGYVTTRKDKTKRKREKLPRKPLKYYVPTFISGFLLLYGARMADGCTSGHMMSGIMQGSVSGYLFAAVVFAVAIPTAMYVGMKYKGNGGNE